MQFSVAILLVISATVFGHPSHENRLNTRADGEIICENSGLTQGNAERENFVEGQEYLRSGIGCSAAAGECSRVSCSNKGAIFLCNESEEDINNMDCSIAADYVDHIFDKCQTDGLYAVDVGCGQQFNTDGWKIEVGWESC